MSQNKVTKVTEITEEAYLNTWSTRWETERPLITIDDIKRKFGEDYQEKFEEFKNYWDAQICHRTVECKIGDHNVTFYLGTITSELPSSKLRLVEAIDDSLDRWTFMYRNVIDNNIPWDQPYRIFNDRAVVMGRPSDEPTEDGIEF
jgi:hypothetical protein